MVTETPSRVGLAVIAYPELEPGDLAWIENIRADADPNHGLIGPHFTLVYPTNVLSPDEMSAHVRERLAENSMIDFVLRGIAIDDARDQGEIYVFLVPNEGRDAIAALHDSLYAGPLEAELRVDLPYRPHMTIGRLPERVAADRLISELALQDVDISGTVAEVQVVDCTSTDFGTLDTIPFASLPG